MRIFRRLALAFPASLLLSVPAYAAGSTVLPEPGGATLLAIGVAGVLIGRRFARKPPSQD